MDKLVRERAVFKSKITIALKTLQNGDEAKRLPLINSMKTNLTEIKVLDRKIEYKLLESENCVNADGTVADSVSRELQQALDYSVTVEATLSGYVKPNVSQVKPISCDLKLPHLKCDTFSGEGNDSLKYYGFITQFQNVIGHRENLAPSIKLTYLKSYLVGYAAKVCQHLLVNDDNYKEALIILDREFLNKQEVVHNIFEKLLNGKVKSDRSYLETKIYINDVKSHLFDLKQYEIDLQDSDSCSSFVSHIVFSKLPEVFRIELARRVSSNYPTISQVFDNYIEIINILTIKAKTLGAAGVGCSDHKPKDNSKVDQDLFVQPREVSDQSSGETSSPE